MKRKAREYQSRMNLVNKIPERKRWMLYPLTTFTALIVIGTATIALLNRNLPSLTELERAGDPLLVTEIISADGVVMKRLFRQQRVKVYLDQIPESMVQATIAIEDRRFFDHWGIDVKRIIKAALVDIAAMSIKQGASTITQQLARKVYLHPKKTVVRKLKEQLTALQIERTYSKPEIIEMYLNQMELGRGAHGVQAAAQAYFGKDVQDLQVHESALLAGMFQLPYGYYTPDRDSLAAIRRRNIVLQTMVASDYLTPAAYDSISELDLGVTDRTENGETIAPYFCEYVRRLMEAQYGLGIYTDGLKIYTSLDTRVQFCADSAVNRFIPVLEEELRSKVIENKAYLKWFDLPPDSILETLSVEELAEVMPDSALIDSVLEDKYTLQTALTAINPVNGHILAMVGGRDFNRWKYNRSVQMKRQPGSMFKPLVYTVAIDNGYSPTYELLNQPVVIIQPDGTRWNPPNYDHSTGGLTTLREGLKRSLNLVSVRLVQEVIPPQKVVEYAEHFGLTTTINPYDAIALGSDVVIPLEITSAYCVFANKGVRVDPVAILRVEDKDGNLLEENASKSREVISEETAFIMRDLMSSVINEGTGGSARWKYNFYRPAAGKTGTTNDYRNAWFAGFTPQIAASVWVGFDDERITMGNGRDGASTALPIWAPFMKMAHDTLRLPLEDFSMPDGVVRQKICSKTKKIATSSCPEIWDEVFLQELAPTDTCEMHASPTRRRRKSSTIF